MYFRKQGIEYPLRFRGRKKMTLHVDASCPVTLQKLCNLYVKAELPRHILMSCLRSRRCRRPVVAEDADEVCPICLTPLLTEACCETNCRHRFHASCIRAWQEQSPHTDSTCPICRQLLDPGSFEAVMSRLRYESTFLSTLTQRMVERADCAWLRVLSARRALNLYLARSGGRVNGIAVGFIDVERDGLHECSQITQLLTELSLRCIRLKENLMQRAQTATLCPTEDIAQWAQEAFANLQTTETLLLKFAGDDIMTSSDSASSSEG